MNGCYGRKQYRKNIKNKCLWVECYFDPFLNDSADYMYAWHDRSMHHNAVMVQAEERFAFDSVAYNQGEDGVHLPLYYYIINSMSSLKLILFRSFATAIKEENTSECGLCSGRVVMCG